MPFVKLDTRILDSTLWLDPIASRVFITALLMAEPREFKEPLEQMEVRSLKPTGLVIPPGWYGWIPTAGVGIIGRARVEMDQGYKALDILTSADDESRSRAFEGRRMIRIDGGYIVLNFMRFRDHDHGAAERMKRLREREKERKKSEAVTANVTSQNGDVHRNVTQAEAEAEADSSVSTLNTSASTSTSVVLPTVGDEPSSLALTPFDPDKKVKVKFPKGKLPPEDPDRGEIFLTFPCIGTESSWALYHGKVAEYKSTYPDLDVEGILRRVKQWLEDEPEERKKASGMKKCLRWQFDKAQEDYDRKQSRRGGPFSNGHAYNPLAKKTITDQSTQQRLAGHEADRARKDRSVAQSVGQPLR